MIIPYSTDAPLYHLPWVTGGIIVTNVVIFFATTFQVMIGNLEPEQIDWLLIQFNQINPLQWLTGNFMHFDPFHLLGNMFFLFCFGLVVEGKVGNARFLAIYLVSCLLIGAVAQVPMFLMGGQEAAAGASGVISTLMVIALVWAPENEISFFYWFFLFVGHAEARIMTICVFFIGMDVLSVVFSGFAMSGAMGHVIGALMGLPIGIYYLRTDQVDCEGWDVISRNDWLQEYPLLYGEKQRRRDQDKHDEIENPVEKALQVTGGDVSKSQWIGLASRKRKPATTPVKTSSRTSSTAVAPKKKARRKKRKSTEVTPERVAQKCQTHPEFNRLAYVLRQSLDSNNLHAAGQAFLRLDALKIGAGLAESTLMRYATQLCSSQRWVDAIRPLAILIEKRGSMADDACLRLAQIQLRILKRNDHAIATLEKIVAPQDQVIEPEKEARLRKRDELLSLARGA
ncbi:rhomboid family intramembrane serine protease [Rhodopirellula sp. JC639]|uniref:rhomboid family intramembrane serine protease n=1 Tax=Stieleria mannarensis TaxID=2755585 RepID=UPI0016022F31|nr:rhomboid family intramembrane serine protease [Rhodopirellula sp. JC639]